METMGNVDKVPKLCKQPCLFDIKRGIAEESRSDVAYICSGCCIDWPQCWVIAATQERNLGNIITYMNISSPEKDIKTNKIKNNYDQYEINASLDTTKRLHRKLN